MNDMKIAAMKWNNTFNAFVSPQSQMKYSKYFLIEEIMRINKENRLI